MLPKTKLGRAMFRKLKVYAGESHPHPAQKPQPLDPEVGVESVEHDTIEYYGTGKRKTSVARVHLRPGTGEIDAQRPDARRVLRRPRGPEDARQASPSR